MNDTTSARPAQSSETVQPPVDSASDKSAVEKSATETTQSPVSPSSTSPSSPAQPIQPQPSAAPASTAPAPPAPEAAAPTAAQPLVILYVEDDPRSRRVIDLLLKREMKLEHVTIFEDSADFVARVKALTPKPNVILLDIHIKPHNGFEMLIMLRAMEGFANVPIVALTASVMNEEVHKLREAGFHSVIAKPLDVDTFPELLQRIAGGETVWRIIEQS